MNRILGRAMRTIAMTLIALFGISGLVALPAVISASPANAAVNNSLDAPKSVAATSPAGNQLTVTWDAPSNAGVVTGYLVDYSLDGTTWQNSGGTLAANLRSHTIGGLSPNTKYFYRVAATSSAGTGSYGYKWTKIYSTSATNRSGTSITYDSGFGLGGSDAAAQNASTAYSRIRYVMNVTYDGSAKWVEADFSKSMSSLSSVSESFTTSSNLDYLRIPTNDGTAANEFEIQGDVSDLTIYSNVVGVENGSELIGRLEHWPWNYSQGVQSGLSSGSANNDGSTYDDGDTPYLSAGYGSFQLHRLSANAASRQTVFAWNNHASTAQAEIGFGNHTGNSHRDWTFCSSAGTCSGRSGFSLGIFINATATTLNTVAISYALNGGSGTAPATTSYTANTSMTLPSASGFSKPGYNFAGWKTGTTTYQVGDSYNVGVTPATMTAQWTSALILDYDVTDTNSYVSGTTLTNRSTGQPNATLSSSGIYNRSSQSLEFSGGSHATVGTINSSVVQNGVTVDIYGNIGNDSSSSWERFIDFGHIKSADDASSSYNMWVGRYQSTNKITFEILNNASRIGYCTSVDNLLDDTIKRFTFVLDGSTCKLFVDGTQVNVNSAGGAAPGSSSLAYSLPTSFATWDKALIAKSNWSLDSATSGKIRSIRLFNNASTPSVIDQVDSNRLVYRTVSYSSPESTVAMPASDVTTGTLTLPLAATATRTGYALSNWFTTATRDVVAAGPGGTRSIPTSTTFYAGWTGNTNSVTWDTQGGSPSVSSTTFVTGGSISAAPASPPTKVDHVLAGWSTTPGGTTVTFPYSPPELTNITLYAKWTLLTTAQSTLSLSSNSSSQYGTPVFLSTTGGSGTGAVTYSVTNGTATGCSISAGSLSATSAGTCLVTATKTSDNTYLSTSTAATAVSFTAKPVSVSAGSVTINYGGTISNTYSAGALVGTDAIGSVVYSYQGTGSTTYGPSATAPTAAGTYSITPSVSSLSSGNIASYAFSYTAGNLIINGISLSAPATVSASANNGVAKSLIVSWASVANATNYTIKISTGGSEVFSVDASGTTATITDARLSNATAYTITVRANGNGNYTSSSFSSSAASATTNTAASLTYNYNGADGGNSRSTDSFVAGGSAITLPTPTRTNYSFAGWFSDSGLTTQVTGPQSPFVDTPLYAKWTQTGYAVTFNQNYIAGVSTSVNVVIGNSTVLPTPSRANFVFDGWYTAQTGGSKIGNAGASYTPDQTRTLYARWIQSSLYGVAPGNLSRIGSLTANDLVSSTYNGTLGSNAVTVTLPNAALPAGTVVALDLITDTSYAQSLLSGTNSYILSIAVSWLALDETVPNTFAGKSVQMVIVNPAIKAGALVFSIQSGTVTLLGRAVTNGTITVELTSDPSVYVVATTPEAPQTITTTPSSTSAVITWTAPSNNGGDEITGYTVTLSNGATCTTTIALTCTFNGLTPGTSYTATIYATNGIGNGTSATATFTANVAGGGVVVTVPVEPQKPVVPVVPEKPVNPVVPEQPIVNKPTIVPIKPVEVIVAVAANNVPVLAGSKIIEPIRFNPDSAKLEAGAKTALAKLVSTFNPAKGVVVVTGFVKYTKTDPAFMKKLANDRAKAVAKELVKLGWKVKIGLVGYGPNNKVNPTPADRKVELRWLSNK